MGFLLSQSSCPCCLLAMYLEVCALSGSAQWSVMGRTKWPATYTWHFALGMQLATTCTPVTDFFPLGVRLCLKRKKKGRSKLIFEVLTTTSGVPLGHILTNLIINALLDANANGNLGKSPIRLTVKGPKLTICHQLRKARKSVSAWNPGLLTLKIQGAVLP